MLRAALAVVALLAVAASALDTGYPNNATCPDPQGTSNQNCPFFYPLPYPAYSPTLPASVLELTSADREAFSARLNQYLEYFLTVQSPSAPVNYTDVYLGSAGFALSMMRLAQLGQTNRSRADLLSLANQYMANALAGIGQDTDCEPYTDVQCTGFLSTHVGVWAVAAVLAQQNGQPAKATAYAELVNNVILNITANPAAGTPEAFPDTFYEGRAGLLYACYFMQLSGVQGACNGTLALTLANAIIQSGAAAGNSSLPLLWKWCNGAGCTGVLFGSAHGLLGVLTQLLSPSSPLRAAGYPAAVKEMLDVLVQMQLPSGNFPTSPFGQKLLGVTADQMVQWCFGGPGFIPVMLYAYQIYNEPAYLAAAESAAEALWARGTKGISLCHGASGNTYFLLQLYNVTGSARYLYYALQIQRYVVNSPLISELGVMRLNTPVPVMSSSFWGGNLHGLMMILSDILSEPAAAQMVGFIGGFDY